MSPFTRLFSLLPAFLFVLIPLHSAFAATPTFEEWVNNTAVGFVDSYVIPLLYAVAFLVFMFGAFRYFFTGGEENREKGRAFLLWSIIGMVAIFSVWGVVNLLLTALPQ
ncbi:MAG: hypothetical protein AAB472_01455 [Patescibacteria group bacterium]